jgi:hypothetical protein
VVVLPAWNVALVPKDATIGCTPHVLHPALTQLAAHLCAGNIDSVKFLTPTRQFKTPAVEKEHRYSSMNW